MVLSHLGDAGDSAHLHRGRILRKRVLPGLGLSVSRAARELGICRQTLHHVRAGTAAVFPGTAARLERLSGVLDRPWLGLQQARDLARAETEFAVVLPGITVYASPDAIRTEPTAYGC